MLRVLVLVLAGWSATAHATDVFPTGDVARDLANLQAAFDQGGTIKLRATDAAGVPRSFELGPDDMILIERDSVISGETVGGAQTTIHGGVDAITNDPTGVNVTIRGIHFDGQSDAAIFLFGVHNATVANNRITNAPHLGLGSLLSDGDVLITGNQVGDPAQPFSNPGQLGIGASPASGTLRITDNIVAGGPTGGFGWTIRVSYPSPTMIASSIELSGNTVYVTNPAGTGIRFSHPGTRASIVRNEIHMNLDSVDASASNNANVGAIVVNGTDNVVVGQNRIVGTSFCGVCLFGSSKCSVSGNNLSGLTVPAGLNLVDYGVSSADIVFGLFNDVIPSDNVAVGPFRTVSDAGTGNQVTGQSVRGGLGATIAKSNRAPLN